MLWTFVFGLWGLSRQDSMWRDEAATWQVAQRSTAEIWHTLANVDVVHGLYYLLMHGLFTCFGPGITTLRLPSVLATAVAAACVAVIGRRVAGTWAGLAGGMVFGLLPAVQFHLQEGRSYALVAAGAALSTLLLTTVLRQPARTRHWAAYGTAVLLTGLLNWLSLMILAAHLTTLLWTRAGRAVLARWTVAAGCATAGVLPLIMFSRSQSAQLAWIPPLSWHMLIGPAVLLAIGGTCALLDRPRAGRPSAAAVGLPLLAVPQLGLIALSLIQPVFLDRYVLYSMLGLALLIGTAVGTTIRAAEPRFPKASRWILPVTLAVTMTALLPQSLAKRSPASRVDDVLAVASDVRRLKRPGNAVLFVPSLRRDTKSVTPDAFAGLRDITLAESPEKSGTLRAVETDPDHIRAALLAEQRVLLVTDAPPAARPPRGAQDTMKTAVLDRYFKPVADKQTRGRRVIVYERRSTPR
ncbi:glycosyltransferase family 39 protein [Streptomyces sp. SudanB182_2057]|uniref:glycosyltransferase family 39 protein n=1 Tax=Streptomyces sp. SudanB182_2057 TaxID=3035281 RepID=UPI003F57A1FE